MTLSKLKEIKEKNYKEILIRNNLKSSSDYKYQVLVCGGTGCNSSGCQKVVKTLKDSIVKHNLNKDILVITTGCFGLCSLGPILIVHPGGYFYDSVKLENVNKIVESHLKNGIVVNELLYKETVNNNEYKSLNEINFFKKQNRLALRNCGIIDPENIEDYIATDGYLALFNVLDNKNNDNIIKTLYDSGLRGRGGGGFLTAKKWDFARKEQNKVKYICCNADEGDPGAFMDRSILEGDPHSIIEAMAIAGYVIGSNQGYIYIRAEYPIAVKRIKFAIEQARKYGFLGNKIFGSEFNFDIEIRLGAGAFVCGEETALLSSIEGNRGEPKPRPPFPAIKGLWGKPTLINNVETYANIPQIILNGAKWFSEIGTEKSKGTKVFALGGKITNVGLVEISMGTTLREIIEEIGGGIPNGKKFKAVQTGGPSGGCIPFTEIDTPIDYENLVSKGSMMGSGGFIVLDEDNCMVDIAKFFLEFTVDESCGKCTPCRIGTQQLYEILKKITDGHGTMEDIEKIKELSLHMQKSSLCALGQTAANPVLSTLKNFYDEYISHIVDKKCPAGVCTNLLTYSIDSKKCIGCTICKKNCPTNAIDGSIKQVHIINNEKCIKCGVCMQKCKFNAIIRT